MYYIIIRILSIIKRRLTLKKQNIQELKNELEYEKNRTQRLLDSNLDLAKKLEKIEEQNAMKKIKKLILTKIRIWKKLTKSILEN